MTHTHYLFEGLRLSPSAISCILSHVDPAKHDTAIDPERTPALDA